MAGEFHDNDNDNDSDGNLAAVRSELGRLRAENARPLHDAGPPARQPLRVTVRDGLLATIKTLQVHLRKSLTWDQGTELAQHRQITLATNMDIYFCDPHSPCVC